MELESLVSDSLRTVSGEVVGTLVSLGACDMIGLLFEDPHLVVCADVARDLAVVVSSLEEAAQRFAVVSVPHTAEAAEGLVGLDHPRFFRVAVPSSERVAALRRCVGGSRALSVPSLAFLARVPRGGADAWAVVNVDGLGMLRRGQLTAAGFPTAWARGCFQAVVAAAGLPGVTVADDVLGSHGWYPGDVVAVSSLLRPEARSLLYVNAPREHDDDHDDHDDSGDVEHRQRDEAVRKSEAGKDDLGVTAGSGGGSGGGGGCDGGEEVYVPAAGVAVFGPLTAIALDLSSPDGTVTIVGPVETQGKASRRRCCGWLHDSGGGRGVGGGSACC
jgi:hypothetical protein